MLIIEKLGDWTDDLTASVFYFVLSIVGVAVCLTYFNWIIALVMMVIFLEIFYHLEPRTKGEIEHGRDFSDVAIYKIGHLLDASWVTWLILLVYEKMPVLVSAVQYLYEHAWEILGYVLIVAVAILSLCLWLYLNWLRDQPKGKKR